MTKENIAFDLESLALQEEAELHLINPRDSQPIYADKAETKPVKIKLYGTASDAYRKAVDKMMAKNAKRGKREATPAEAREQSVDFLAALSISTENLNMNGAPIDTVEGFKELYSNSKFSWVREQVDAFLGNTESFLSK